MSHPPLLLLLPLIISISISTSLFSLASSSPLSTIALSHVSNVTLACALLPSSSGSYPYELNCTSFPGNKTRHYPAGTVPYSAIAAGDGFLCGLTSPFDRNVSTMKWWDFAHNPHNNSLPDAKRVYKGPSLSSLSAGDSHVCGLTSGSKHLNCWRWPQLEIPTGLKPDQIAVGGDFVCALLGTGEIECFNGGGSSGVVGNEPEGSFVTLAAGSSHVCAISIHGELVCWGNGAPKVPKNLPTIDWMALGKDRTCVLDSNAKVHCWGENFQLPDDVVNTPFVAIQARGDAFCGVLMTNFSMICWGTDAFRGHHVVFKQVLPGTCALECQCLPLAGTGFLCGNGASVCRPCPNKKLAITPPTGPNSNPPAPVNPNNSHSGKRRVIFIVIGSVGFVVGLVAVACFLLYRYRLHKGRIHDSAASRSTPTNRPQQQADPNMDRIVEFPLKLLLSITDNFSDSHKIGSGSFGSVYRASLTDGRTVAIKRAESSKAETSTSRHRTPTTPRARTPESRARTQYQSKESAFCAEVALLSRVNHKNLVRLFGYCNEGSERILVYEFMINGTLHDLLHKWPQHSSGSPLGSWAARIRVALDAARGIEYLHTYAVPPIIHRDIKSSNILLDERWVAKVADFGLSLLNNNESNLSHLAAGTVGYMDPEYYRLQHLTAKSDVYSFGVVLLEILSGCKVIQRYEESGTPKNVVEYTVPSIVADDIHRVLDVRIAPPTPCEIEAVAFVGYLAADCVNQEGEDRPNMTTVVNGLERALAAITGPTSVSRSSSSVASRSSLSGRDCS